LLLLLLFVFQGDKFFSEAHLQYCLLGTILSLLMVVVVLSE
jgi:hypothetical protein